MFENSRLAETGDRRVDFPCGVGQVLSWVVDRQDGISRDAMGDRLSCGEGFSVGGVGEVDVVEGVVSSRRSERSPSARVAIAPLPPWLRHV